MNDQQNRWSRVGDLLTRRIKSLGLTKAEVIRRSGVSGKTLDSYLGGAPIKRADKGADLCIALGWMPDSIDLALNGNSPVTIGDAEHELDQQEAELAGRPAGAELRDRREHVGRARSQWDLAGADSRGGPNQGEAPGSVDRSSHAHMTRSLIDTAAAVLNAAVQGDADTRARTLDGGGLEVARQSVNLASTLAQNLVDRDPDRVTTEDAIQTDPLLTPEARRHLLAEYRTIAVPRSG